MTVNKLVAGKQRNFQAVTTLFSQNSITINRDGNDRITSVVVGDGITIKTMTFGYNLNNKLISVSTVVTEP